MYEDIKPIAIEDLPIWTCELIMCSLCGFLHASVHIMHTERVECPNCNFMTATRYCDEAKF